MRAGARLSGGVPVHPSADSIASRRSRYSSVVSVVQHSSVLQPSMRAGGRADTLGKRKSAPGDLVPDTLEPRRSAGGQ